MPSKSAGPRDWANRGSGCSTIIFIATGAYLALGLLSYIAWQPFGHPQWIDIFFGFPTAVLVPILALIEWHYAVKVRRQFNSGQTLYRAWQLISLSAACDFAGAFATQLLSRDSVLNPFAYLPGWSKEWSPAIRQLGMTAGGPARFMLLAGGLCYVLHTYRESGFQARLKFSDWLVLAVVAAYVINEFRGVWVALQQGRRPGWAEIVNWPVDPLLCLLLGQAMLLYRSAMRMGLGWIGRCWIALSIGVGLIVLGDVCLWATNYDYLPYPWSNIQWYLWPPGAAAFALAPLYQWEAIQRASAAESEG